VTKTYISICEN